jgi:hypothetical protein
MSYCTADAGAAADDELSSLSSHELGSDGLGLALS